MTEAVNYSVRMDEIASRLREVRGSRSTREAARIVGQLLSRDPSHSSVGEYERGTEPPATYVAAFCKAFEVNPGWLLYGSGPKHVVKDSLMDLVMQIQVETVDLIRDPRHSEEEVGDLLRRSLSWLRGEDPGAG